MTPRHFISVGPAADPRERIESLMRFVGDRADLVHKSMIYHCRDCHTMEVIYLGVGVEGPDKLEHRDWIASPFGITCPKCGSSDMFHNWWFMDQVFREPIRPPVGARYFRIPDGGPRPDYLETVVFAGEMRTAE